MLFFVAEQQKGRKMLNFENLTKAARNGFGMQVNQICHLYGNLKVIEAKYAQGIDPNNYRNVPGHIVSATEEDVSKAVNVFTNAIVNLHCTVRKMTGVEILTELVGNRESKMRLVQEFDDIVCRKSNMQNMKKTAS